MDKMKHRRLQELDRSDFEIVKGEPDIRGWDVRNTVGKKIGEVEDLIIDAQQKKVRYMVVDLDDNELDLDHRKVLIPIGLAELHEKDDDVILPNVQAEQLRSLPGYAKDHLDEDIERSVCTTLGRKSVPIVKKSDTGNTITPGANSSASKQTTSNTTGNATGQTTGESAKTAEHEGDFYQHDYFNDDNLYKHRLHEAKPANQDKGMSDYEKGLRLWEKRSEGGIIESGDINRSGTNTDNRTRGEDTYNEREVGEEARMEMVRNRRTTYQQRRASIGDRDDYRDHNQPHRKHNSIIDRLKDEGLREV
jgi:sporulation protein YlmC with PRC-barrel domain